MESMNVQEMTDRLKVRYKNISDNTKKIWDKSIRWIDKTNVADVDDDLAAEWLESEEDENHIEWLHRRRASEIRHAKRTCSVSLAQSSMLQIQIIKYHQ